MKKKKVGVNKEGWQWFAMIVLTLIIIGAMAYDSFGATYTWTSPQYYFGTDYDFDSLIYRVSVYGVTRDSTLYSAADTVSGGYVQDTLTFSTDTLYACEVRTFEGSAWGQWGNVPVSMQAAITSASFSGSGSYSTTIYTIDTSGTDDTVSGKTVVVRDLAGTEQAWPQATENGYITYSLDDTVILSIQDTWYTWVTDTHVVSSDTTLSVVGYDNINVSAPSSANMCAVYGYVRAFQDTGGVAAPQWALLTFTTDEHFQDTCNGDSVITISAPQRCKTNSSGYFQINLLRSKCMSGKKYRVQVEVYDYAGNRIELYPESRKKYITVPDSGTYRLSL